MKRTLIWFRNDLRLHDHEALTAAIGKSAEIVPYYCFDVRQWKDTIYGFPKTGAFRTRFLIDSVQNLAHQIESVGGKLVVQTGIPEELIPRLVAQLHIDAVYTHKEVTDEEIKVEEALEHQLWKYRVPLTYFWGHTLYHLEDLPFPTRNLPAVFTDFRKQVERYVNVRPAFPVPARIRVPSELPPTVIPSITGFGLAKPIADERAAFSFTGGETEGLARLHDYIWEGNLLKSYRETRNELIGADYSSKLAPWLALGCLSPRHVYTEVKKYEQQRVKNESTYWLVFELLWRDYFRFIARKHGNALFKSGGIRELPAREAIHPGYDNEVSERWRNGTTGIPFIDASMTELLCTGYLSGRGRQNVASFLVKELRVDWRAGAAWFESQLVDYDPCSNYGNWNYVAGIGNDPREDRHFNVIRQAQQYDPKGEYVKLWMPVLAKLSASHVHTPYLLSTRELDSCGVQLGRNYPEPLTELRAGEYSK